MKLLIVQCSSRVTLLRTFWREQKGNQNPYIKEQTTQWRKEKVQKEKQRSTKHTYQAKGRVTRVPLKIEVNAGALEGSVGPAVLVAPVVLIYLQTRWSLWHIYHITVNQVMVATVTFSRWWLHLYQMNPCFSSFIVSSILYQEILIGATRYRISYHLRDIYSICMCFWNGATYKWKVHNGKILIISFVVQFRS